MEENLIDHFRDVADWMAYVDRRLSNLERQLETTSKLCVHNGTRLNDLERFAASLRVVMLPQKESEKAE